MWDRVGAKLNIRASWLLAPDRVYRSNEPRGALGALLLHNDISQGVAESVSLVSKLKRGGGVRRPGQLRETCQSLFQHHTWYELVETGDIRSSPAGPPPPPLLHPRPPARRRPWQRLVSPRAAQMEGRLACWRPGRKPPPASLSCPAWRLCRLCERFLVVSERPCWPWCLRVFALVLRWRQRWSRCVRRVLRQLGSRVTHCMTSNPKNSRRSRLRWGLRPRPTGGWG